MIIDDNGKGMRIAHDIVSRARTAFASSSRTAHEMNALARPFAPVSRELRYPVHGSLLTKNAGGLLNAPPGNGKPAYIPRIIVS